MALGQRLKQEREARGWSQEQLAKEAGLPENSGQATVHAIESRDSKRTQYAGDFAKALNLELEWLSYGTGPKFRGSSSTDGNKFELGHKIESPQSPNGNRGGGLVLGVLQDWDDSTPLDDDEVELPLLKETEFAAGSGFAAPSVEDTGLKLRFSRSTLKKAGVDPANAACATNRGRSMERLIMDEATIGIDRGRTQIKDGKIYALEHNGELRVKYLYRLPGGGLRLRSENSEEYPDENYGPGWAEQIRVLGWVFWWSRLETW